jgi:hypothetical protein
LIPLNRKGGENMKKLLAIFVFALGIVSFVPQAHAGWVNGYFRSDGTYVNGYYRSDPNGLKYDNYSWDSDDDWYNPSYYDTSYSSSWRTPSWETQDDYWTGLDYYDDYNDYDGYWSY